MQSIIKAWQHLETDLLLHFSPAIPIRYSQEDVSNKPTLWTSLVKHLINQRLHEPQFSISFLFIVRLWWLWTLAPCLNCIVSVYCKYSNCIDLWNLAARPCAVLGWAQWRIDDFGFFGSVPFFSAAGYDRVRTSMHHPGVEAVGHREGLQMAL